MNPRQKQGLNMAVDTECTTKTDFWEKNACFWAEAEHNVKMINSKFLYKGSAEMISGRNE